MKKEEIITKKIFSPAFGGEKNVTRGNIKKKIINSLINICSIPENEISEYFSSDDEKATLYFKEADEYPQFNSKSNYNFIPIKVADALKNSRKNYNNKIGIPAIYDAFEKNKPRINTIKLILFLFQIKLSEDLENVLFGKISNSDILDDFKNYLKEIKNGSETREDVLALMIDVLNDQNVTSATFVTNDIHFTFNIIPSIVQFIISGKPLWLLFDPASVSDLISYRLFLLKQIGLNIKILPIKNKYPVFGVIPNWTPDLIDNNFQSVFKILKFKTFFFEKEEGVNYSQVIKSHEEIKKIILDIIEFDKGVGKNTPIQLKKVNLKYSLILEDTYLSFLNDCFNTNEKNNKVYNNAKFSFKTFEIDNLYSRSQSITYYKAMQMYYFIENNKETFVFDDDKETVYIKPYNLKILDKIYPINPPFIEFNKQENRYEVGEGHSRIWVLYNIYNIKKINTICVDNIRAEYFEPNQEKIIQYFEKQNPKISNNWSFEHLKCNSKLNDPNENILASRNIEIFTHRIPTENFVELFNELVKQKILEKDDYKYSNTLNKFFSKK